MKNLDCPDVKYTEYAETRFDCSDWKNFDVESWKVEKDEKFQKVEKNG